MLLSEDINKEIRTIFRTDWKRRDGTVIPEAERVQLGNDAVCLKGTLLYADLADSTELVNGYKDWFVAEIYKSYLVATCRLIRANGGVITAFDGDRVMAAFIGESMIMSAAKTALMINYIVRNIINRAITELYPSTGYMIQQAVGIDTGDLFIARTGIRGSNDLVWVGRAANYAAKLCALREGVYSSFITEEVFNALDKSLKFGQDSRSCIWEKIMWKERGIPIYRSSWWMTPD